MDYWDMEFGAPMTRRTGKDLGTSWLQTPCTTSRGGRR